MKANLVEMDIHIRMKGHLNNNGIAKKDRTKEHG